MRSTDGTDAATRLLERCTTNTLPKQPGRCRLTYATTRAGKVLAEFTITRRGAPELQVTMQSRYSPLAGCLAGRLAGWLSD